MSEPRTASFATADGLVTVESRPDPSRRAQRREAEHHAFLVDHWAELKAAAHAGFQEYGAGTVVLWRESEPRRWRPRPFQPERLWYSTQVHVLPGATEADFDGWEAELIERYDPALEALVVFVEGSQITGYGLRGTLSPREARQRAGRRLN